MNWIGRRMREMSRAIVGLNRRVAASDLPGVVVGRDEAGWKVRLDLGEDPETGDKILSPWVSPLSESAGALKRSGPLPAIGDAMRLISPSGEVGADSYVVFGGFSEGNKRPDQNVDEGVLTYGENRQSIAPDRQRIERTGAKKSAIDVRSEGRVVAEVHESLAKLKIRIRKPDGRDEWWRLKPEALLPTTEDE